MNASSSDFVLAISVVEVVALSLAEKVDSDWVVGGIIRIAIGALNGTGLRVQGFKASVRDGTRSLSCGSNS